MKQSKIAFFEPWFFLFFGLFHLHRIWGLVDRNAYADFWMSVLEQKGAFYYSLMGILAVLCLLGIGVFFRNIHQNYWWRWIYLFGGAYVLFDLFAIAAGWTVWMDLLHGMFDVQAPYWNFLWSAFVVLGGAVFLLGLFLLKKRREMTA